MPTWVPPPPIPPPRWPGLVASVGGEAAVRLFMAANSGDDGPLRWEAGFRFTPNACDLGSEDPVPTEACSAVALDVSDDARPPGSVDVSPLAYWAAARCSTFGSTMSQVTDSAVAKLQASTSHKLEHEFWTGDVNRALGRDSQYLTDSNVTEVDSGDPVPLVYALAHLQQAAGACAQGQRLMVHCAPITASLWLAAGAVRREAGFLLDAFDNVVVAGTGYDGSSPSHSVDSTLSTAWAYATTLVNVRLGDVQVISVGGDRLDVANNVDTAIAWRAGAVSHDSCCKYGVNVDHTSVCG